MERVVRLTMPRGRKPVWPPQPKTRRGKWYVRVPNAAGGYSEVTLGPAESDEARRELARIVAETAVGGVPAGGITVDAAVLDYMAARAGRDEQRTLDRRRLALQVVLDLYGHKPLSSFGPLALKACRLRWVEAGYARVYVNALACCLRAWMKWCASEEKCQHSQALALTSVAGLRAGETAAPEREGRQPADPEAVRRTLPHLRPVPRAMAELQLLTGMRPGEVCRLTPGMIDRDWMAVDGVTVWLARFKAHKGRWRGHKREVPVGPLAQALLTQFLQCGKNEPCFANAGGRPFHVRHYDRNVARACAAAGVDPWTPHQLRHRVGTDVYTDYGMDDAQAVLGHDSPDATAIYAKRLQRAARVIARIG